MTIRCRTGTRGFTLVELLIVVIIIGILAALALPLFSSSTQDANEATLRSNIVVLRNAIDLYRVQHDFIYPGERMTNGSGNPNPNDNTRTTAFIEQLTRYTDKTGKTASAASAAFPYGPYISSRAIPDNPLAPAGVSVTTVLATADTGPLAPDSTTAWKFSVATGQIIANHPTYSGF